jgi:hypothetical protein
MRVGRRIGGEERARGISPALIAASLARLAAVVLSDHPRAAAPRAPSALAMAIRDPSGLEG